MTIVIEWLKANWRYPTCIVLGVLLGIFLGRASKPQESIHVEATQAQSGTIQTQSHITIKPQAPIPGPAGCPPCPQLPEVTVDCGGSAKGSQGQSISATASASTGGQIGLWLGLGSTQTGTLDANCMVTYGNWGLMGQYDQKNVYGAKVLFKALEFH